MQFIESSVIGLRAACHVLRSPEHGAEICLFPMIHIGTANFYAEVRRRLEACDGAAESASAAAATIIDTFAALEQASGERHAEE